MKRTLPVNIFVFVVLIAFGVASRWISDAGQPTLSNVTATAAASLFAGFFFVPRFIALLVPLAIVALSNLGLPKYNNKAEMGVAFALLLLPAVLGWFLQRRSSVVRIFGFAATPAILFYLISDLVFWPGFELYPKTLAGQIDSYIAAIPFSAKMLAGDLFYTGLIFGTYWLAASFGYVADRRRELAPATVIRE